MKKGILFVILLFLYSCEKKEDLNSEKGEIKLTCDISSASKKRICRGMGVLLDRFGRLSTFLLYLGGRIDGQERTKRVDS